MIKALLLALFLPLVASAQGVEPVRLADFTGGVNDFLDPTAINANEASYAQNLIFDEGGLKPRKGFTLCGELPSGNVITEMIDFTRTSGVSSLVVTDNQNFYETRDCITFTRFRDGMNVNFKPSFEIVRDELWVVNRDTHPFTWDGSTTTILDGSTNTPLPAPPNCQYLEFWKERVWCARSTSNPSEVAFSAIADSAGNDLHPSTGTTSWPAINTIQVDQEGGSPIYGIKAFRDSLYVFKNNGIWRIAFNNPFDVALIKTMSSVGSRSGSSIVEMNNTLYFVGTDGIYAFDGSSSIRISDKITNKFNDLNQTQFNALFETWTTESDFLTGTLDLVSTTTVNSIELSVSTESITEGGFEVDDLVDDVGNATWTCEGTPIDTFDRCHFSSAYALAGDNGAQVRSHCNSAGPDGGHHRMDVHLASDDSVLETWNLAADCATGCTQSVSDHLGLVIYIKFVASSNGGVTMGLKSSNFTAVNDITWTAEQAGDRFSCIDHGTAAGFNKLDLIGATVYQTSGTWTSDQFDTVTVSTWGVFESDFVTNAGNIAFEIRMGSNTNAINGKAYSSITSGALIDGTTWETIVQIKSVLTSDTTRATTPIMDSVSVGFNQGGTVSTPIFGIKWDNKYWVSASSGDASTNNLVMNTSRYDPSSWMFHTVKFGPMAEWNDKFYVAASTHSAIYRMDNGTNDNGEAFTWEWQTGDIEWGVPWVRKELQKITVEYRGASADTVSVGSSRDSGVTFTNNTVDMSVTGRHSKTLFINGGNAFDFRLRVADDDLDESAIILGLTGWARKFKVLE